MTKLFNKISNRAENVDNTGNTTMATGDNVEVAVGEYKCSQGTCAR
eukprot:CAMPEP_0118654324 /NCGR_PEP_ID=MMETSP0785-20121206/12328_1 /TAXON_ID=91992 /ORGANISM="Bolidomonas pacifica, Strain CCMP 1866" /LENGTH=45 /DNA_ID= /DNA_START= /DNA_END= /DNA_ORIENTATION=